MKTFASILLLLALGQAAAHSGKSLKLEDSSMSIQLHGAKAVKKAKGAKSHFEPIRRFLIDEERALKSSSEGSMPFHLFSSSKSAKKSVDPKSGKSRRFLDVDGSEDLSMSLDLSAVSGKSLKTRIDAKSLKTASSESKSRSSSKSGKVQPKRRSIDPTISNDSAPVKKTLSFLQLQERGSDVELEDSSAGALSAAFFALLPLVASAAFSY